MTTPRPLDVFDTIVNRVTKIRAPDGAYGHAVTRAVAHAARTVLTAAEHTVCFLFDREGRPVRETGQLVALWVTVERRHPQDEADAIVGEMLAAEPADARGCLRGRKFRPKAPRCDMARACLEPITHIDNKGYVYCRKHGEERKATTRCRRLTPAEKRTIESGKPIAEY